MESWESEGRTLEDGIGFRGQISQRVLQGRHLAANRRSEGYPGGRTCMGIKGGDKRAETPSKRKDGEEGAVDKNQQGGFYPEKKVKPLGDAVGQPGPGLEKEESEGVVGP